MAKAFFDTNVLLYLLSSDAAKADRAEQLLAGGGVVGVQVLNEFASVASRKLKMNWAEIGETLEAVRVACMVEPLSIEVHDAAVTLVQRYSLSFYDALIAAAALTGGCDILYSEDMHDGLIIEGSLTIRNPFKS